MGLMRFACPYDPITEDMVQQAYLAGFDRVPWLTQARSTGSELVLQRAVTDSGVLYLPWPVEGHGPVVLSSGTLMERDEAYYLPLELARGKLSQVRNQLADWQSIGLVVPEAVHTKLAEALGYFAQAAVIEHASERSARLAGESIRAALEAANLLATCYVEQALAVRHRTAPKLPTLLGADLGLSPLDEPTARQFLATFNAANVPMVWRQIETSEGNYCWDVADRQMAWCRANRLSVTAGPLVQLDPAAIPDWLYLYEEDFESILSFARQFVQAAVERYRGQVDLWQVTGRVNTADILGLTEEEVVKLAAETVQLVRSLDEKTPTVVAFDQPWAEYLSRRPMDFPPLHFADVLVRANLGLSGLMLEVNMGYHPGGSLLRDLLEVSRQLDHWSLLGVPLFVSLCAPSSAQDDPLAQRPAKAPSNHWNARSQQVFAYRYVALLLAKPYIHGVLWNQLRDSEPHIFPHGGLFDLRRHPKPALRQLASLRQAHLR